MQGVPELGCLLMAARGIWCGKGFQQTFTTVQTFPMIHTWEFSRSFDLITVSGLVDRDPFSSH